MLKKVILSSLLTFIIITNLILWPYLYKQFKGEDTYSEPEKQMISNETTGSEETVLPDEDDVSDQKEVNDEDVQTENKLEESKEEFKVVDIK